MSTSTPTSSPTVTSTATPTAPTHLVISELRSRGPGGTDDEFVELYNPTGASVNIGGWTIKRSSSCGTTTYTLVTINSGATLLPGQHYLMAATGSGVSNPDQTFSAALADDGGAALVNSSGTVVDQIGMCVSTQYREGMNLPPLTATADQSYERKPGGSTACYDTDNNSTDFNLISPSNPQNKASPIVMCSGVVTSTPTLTPSRTLTRTPTLSPSRTLSRTPTLVPSRTLTPTPTHPPTAIPSTLVINEFLPHPRSDWNGDQVVNVGDEYIEIINIGTATINLKDWKLDNGGAHQYTLPDTTLLPRQINVFYHSETGISLSDGGGTVRLINTGGRIVDAFTYPVVAASDQTWCRLPDGNGIWAFACRPSPGWPNASLVSPTPVPASGTVTKDNCPLADTVPPAVLSAECEGFGSGILKDLEEMPLWLEHHGKWDVFIQ